MLCMLFLIMTTVNRIRDYARQHYIEPARRRGEGTVRIVAGDVHRSLSLNNRVPAVCAALQGKKFLTENHLRLDAREGPPSGMSTTMVFTYRIEGSGRGEGVPLSTFLQARGIAKDVFQSLGGGEAFLKAERDEFKAEP